GGSLARSGIDQYARFSIDDLLRDTHAVGQSNRGQAAPQRFADHLPIGFAERSVDEKICMPVEAGDLLQRSLTQEEGSLGDLQAAGELHERVVVRTVPDQRQAGVGNRRRDETREDLEQPSNLLFTRHAAHHQESSAPPRFGWERIVVAAALEDAWVDAARDHVNRNPNAALFPITLESF